MSRATPDDQLKFLLSCVKFSNNGKIDFVEVARECNVVSKGAAAKRYERLLKANGIQPGGGTSSEKPPSDIPPRFKKVTKPETSNKRKRPEYSGETGKHEGDDETMSQRHIKRERLEPPYMHETPMNSRGPTFNPYMHPHPPYMHAAMPPFLHQNMRPSSQYPMMPAPHMPYGNISGVVPNHSFMMPQQSMSAYPMPQTMQSSPLHDSNIGSNTFEDSYYATPPNNLNMDSTPVHNADFLDTAISNNSILPAPSKETDRQAVSTQSSDSKLLVKHEHDPNVLPSSFLDYLMTDVKVESDSIEPKECASAKTTDVPASSSTTEAESIRTTISPQEIKNGNVIASDGDSNVKKEENSRSANECIFISD